MEEVYRADVIMPGEGKDDLTAKVFGPREPRKGHEIRELPDGLLALIFQRIGNRLFERHCLALGQRLAEGVFAKPILGKA